MPIFAGMRLDVHRELAPRHEGEQTSNGFIVLSGGRMIFIDESSLADARRTDLSKEMFILALFMGERAQVHICGKAYELRENSLLVCGQHQIEHTSGMDIGRVRCICLSGECLKDLFLLASNSWDVKVYLENHPVFQLNEAEANLFSRYFDLFRARLRCYRASYREELNEALLNALMYDLYAFLEEDMQQAPAPYSSSDQLFRNFVQLLHETYPKPRLIAPYADKLCVTAKYLSAVCKRVSGKTASELIDTYVVRDIRYLLGRRDKSIKEISNELEFPNISFFGKYVKQHLGLSPRSFRRQLASMADCKEV